MIRRIARWLLGSAVPSPEELACLTAFVKAVVPRAERQEVLKEARELYLETGSASLAVPEGYWWRWRDFRAGWKAGLRYPPEE